MLVYKYFGEIQILFLLSQLNHKPALEKQILWLETGALFWKRGWFKLLRIMQYLQKSSMVAWWSQKNLAFYWNSKNSMILSQVLDNPSNYKTWWAERKQMKIALLLSVVNPNWNISIGRFSKPGLERSKGRKGPKTEAGATKDQLGFLWWVAWWKFWPLFITVNAVTTVIVYINIPWRILF